MTACFSASLPFPPRTERCSAASPVMNRAFHLHSASPLLISPFFMRQVGVILIISAAPPCGASKSVILPLLQPLTQPSRRFSQPSRLLDHSSVFFAVKACASLKRRLGQRRRNLLRAAGESTRGKTGSRRRVNNSWHLRVGERTW